MKKYLLSLSILSGLLYAGSTQNTPVELGYKQIKLGMTSEEINALSGLHFHKCDASVCIEDSFGNTLGGSVLNRPVLIMMKENKAGAIYLESDSKNFSQISLAYITKYGEPTEKIDGVVQNRMGAEFSNKKYTWKNSDGFITLQERSKTVDKMSIKIISNSYLQSSAKDLEKNVQKNSGDL